jgi:multidrug resistance efflux pump
MRRGAYTAVRVGVGLATMTLVALLGTIVLRAAPRSVDADLAELLKRGGEDECRIRARMIEVPAEEQGRLVEVKVEEGDEVTANQPLAVIDKRQAQALFKVAQAKLNAAATEAASDVNKRYADMTRKVAHLDYSGAYYTNEKTPGAVTAFELRQYYAKAMQGDLHVEQADNDWKIAQEKLKVQEAEAEAAKLELDRREITAPANGVVEKKYRERGEWVKPGDPVFQVLLMNRLLVYQLVDARRVAPAQVKGKKVRVTVELENKRLVTVEGTVRNYSHREEADRMFLVTAEVDNRKENGHWLLRHGQPGRMEILMDSPASLGSRPTPSPPGNPP